MNRIFYNDQAFIANTFLMNEDYIARTARLAIFKINSFKLTSIKIAEKSQNSGIAELLYKSLLNYTDNASILINEGFFKGEISN